jgi:hypothetical protein
VPSRRGGRFERAQAGGADRHHAAAARARARRLGRGGRTSYHSLCIRCSASARTRTGWKVPAPTCSVTRALRTPRRAAPPSSALVEVQPAVGAATAPGRLAYTVW